MSLASVLVIDGGSRCLWSLRTIAVWDLVEMHLSSPTVQTNMSLLPDSRSVLSSIGGVYQNPAYWIVLLAILDILYYYDMKCFDRSMISECTFKSGEVNVYVFCISDIESLSLKCLQILRTEALLAPKAIKPTARKKVNIFYNGLGTMNCQFLDSQGPIPGITPAQALTTIQTMADHSQKWHNGSSSRNVNNSSNSEGIAAILTMEILVDHFQTTAEITIDLMEECLDNHRQEEDEVRMNPKYLALLQNQLPHKEKDPGSFILPCSIKRLDFNNALADLGASISVMPFSMYKRLGIGKLEPINMDFKMPIILGRPLLATSHAKVDIFKKSISLEVGNEKVIFKMRNSFTTTTIESIHAIRSEIRTKDDETEKETNMGKQLDLASVRKQKDYWRQEFNEDQDDIDPTVEVEDGEDPEECEEDKANAIL
ncbi:hypothetical protein Tco_0566750 [Tanacetum coccineum]